ncbi:MAG: hypothetical protein JXR71_09460 [Bacteroidales bacterium]|nr:hypothetical protein [Bacteroidales bacterium]
MKKITYILLLAIAVFALNSCSKDIPGTSDINYVTFEKSAYQYNVQPDSTFLKDINIYTTQVSSSDRTFGVTVNAASDLDAGSYSVPATITVPANTNKGVLTISLKDQNISPNGSTLILDMTPQAGLFIGKSQVTITVNEFCPLQNNPGDFAGTWTGTDAYYVTNNVQMTVQSSSLLVDGLNVGWITDAWGESIVSGGSILMTVNNDGTIVIPRQYIFTTLYSGANYDYEIKGTGTWKNCGTPSMVLTYDIYYAGDATGLGGYYYGTPFVADLTLGSAPVIKSAPQLPPMKHKISKQK